MAETSVTEAPPREPEIETIDTEHFEYKGIGIRAVAQIVDGIVLFAAFWVVGLGVGALMGGLTSTGFEIQGAAALVFFALYAGFAVGYFVALEGLYGQTLGKRLTRIQVVTESGAPCGLFPSFVRNVLRVIDGILFYLVGMLLIATSKKKQRLGDRVANTVVVGVGETQ